MNGLVIKQKPMESGSRSVCGCARAEGLPHTGPHTSDGLSGTCAPRRCDPDAGACPAAETDGSDSPSRRARVRGFAPVVGATIAMLLLLRVLTSAQDVTAVALKAVFIYHFAKFTEWPAAVLPGNESFVMCVIGDPAFGDALVRAVHGRAIGDQGIKVTQVPAAEPPRGCHVLYVSGLTAKQVAPILAGVRDAPVLTVSDIDGFTDVGGIAQLFFERGQLRFRVQQEFAKRARLKISSRLLMLAK